MKLCDITPLFVFELANNHMGSVELGLRAIREISDVSRSFPWHFAFKFQYRDLDTFIHPQFRNSNLKYIRRFMETRLSPDQFRRLKDELDSLGLISICTPFDEASVDLIEQHGIDIIKIASCSFTDWPLLERVVQTSKPIIASVAGEPVDNIDKVVSFFQHRQKDMALMHCIASYPTLPDALVMNQIDLLRARYPQVPVGFSTHESPDQSDPIKLAVAKGAVIFEKHVAVAGEGISPNSYSATPEQIRHWLESAQQAFIMCGPQGSRYKPGEQELSSLHDLRRGIYARRTIAKGSRLQPGDIFRAIPAQGGQLTANEMSKYAEFHALEEIGEKKPVLKSQLQVVNNRDKIYKVIQEVKQVLTDSNLSLPSQVDMEISHHYGIDRFYQVGITMLEIVNREYCKKLLVMLPNQLHPEQYHQVKEETFHILHGEVYIALNGKEELYRAGDVVTAERGVRHTMRSLTGVVIEEISTKHHIEDSYYTDLEIMANAERKTLVTHWMR